MSPEDEVHELVERGHALLTRERAVLLAADFGPVEALAAEKGALLAALSEAVGRARGTDALRTALARLIEESRRNERILEAVLRGLRSARRRMAAIMAARRGEVAYAADGTRITSSADSISKNRTA